MLDEPFSGLDPTGVDVMSGVLRERAAAGVPGRLLLATSSSSSSGCARTSRSSRTAGSSPPARSRSCASAAASEVEQVRVRVEGDGDGALGRRPCPAPSWPRPARAACSSGCPATARPDAAARRRPRAPAPSRTSASSARRSPTSSARRWRRERRARPSRWSRGARSVPSGSREKSFLIGTGVSLAIIVLVVVLPSLLGFGGRDEYTITVAGPGARRRSREAAVAQAGAFDADVTVEARAPRWPTSTPRSPRDGIRAQEKPDDELRRDPAGRQRARSRSARALEQAGLDEREAARGARPAAARALDRRADQRGRGPRRLRLLRRAAALRPADRDRHLRGHGRGGGEELARRRAAALDAQARRTCWRGR